MAYFFEQKYTKAYNLQINNYIAVMKGKKTRTHNYEEVQKLPHNALRVSEYAAWRNCNTSYIYELVRKGHGGFKMVVFKGINFVIPAAEGKRLTKS
jgi:hypothetical protein